ncbi:hypothetical protein FOZ62_007108, partial [Perkinsus olseni]
SCVNVMGAQQFHPEEHKDLITRYYTYFYASINLGSIVGGIVTPILVESVSFTASFSFPPPPVHCCPPFVRPHTFPSSPISMNVEVVLYPCRASCVVELSVCANE